MSKKINVKKQTQKQQPVAKQAKLQIQPMDQPSSVHIPSQSIPYRNPILLIGSLALLLIAGVLISHWQAIYADRFLDDYVHYIQNPRVQNPWLLFNDLTNFVLRRGWVQLSLGIDMALYQDFMTGAHFSSILYHLIAAFLVWLTVSKLFTMLLPQASHFPMGFITAWIFAIHPLSTQPIAHLSSRSDILATIAYLLGVYVGLCLVKQCLQASTHKQKLFWLVFQFVLVSIITVLGLGAKEIIVTLPATVFLLNIILFQYHKINGQKINFAIYGIGLGFACLGYGVIRYIAFGSVLGIPDMQVRTVSENLLTQSTVIVYYYLPKIIVPYPLYYDPYYPVYAQLAQPSVLGSLAVLLAMVVVIFRYWKTYPIVCFGLAWFLITLLPTSSFVILADVVAERRVYLPMIGLLLIAEFVWLVAWRTSQTLSKLAVMLVISSLLIGLSIQRNLEFGNMISLMKKEILQQARYDAIKARSIHFLVQAMTPETRDDICRFISHLDYDFQEHLNALYRMEGMNYKNFHDFMVFMTFCNYDPAVTNELFFQHLEYEPENVEIWADYQNFLLVNNRYDQAHKAIEYALNINPNHVQSLLNLSNIHLINQDPQAATEIIDRLVEEHPESSLVLQHAIRFYPKVGRDTTELEQRFQALNVKNKVYSETREVGK